MSPRRRTLPSNRAAWIGLGCFFLGIATLSACNPEPDAAPSVDSKSNWLKVCATDNDCDSGLSCLCGVCSQTCAKDDECSGELAARCVVPASYAECPTKGSEEASCVATCNVADDCDVGQICLREVCVTEALPEALACDAALDWSTEDAEFEALVVDAVNRQRAFGTECDNASFQALEPLVLDFRLRCAARLHAAEMVSQEYFDEVGPDGTTAGARITAAGYQFNTWGLVIAQGSSPQNVADALAVYCDVPSDPGYVDVGVGAYDSTWALYLAAPAVR